MHKSALGDHKCPIGGQRGGIGSQNCPIDGERDGIGVEVHLDAGGGVSVARLCRSRYLLNI